MGSVETWASHMAVFAAHGFRCIAVDLIGHGASDAPVEPGRYRMARCVADLVQVLDTLEVEQVALLGYSMGGRVALQLTSTASERVARLVLESASPGIADPAERHRRAEADDALAKALERDGLPAFVDRWAQQPLFASQQALPADVRARLRAQRLCQRPLGLANSLRGCGAGDNRACGTHCPRCACQPCSWSGPWTRSIVRWGAPWPRRSRGRSWRWCRTPAMPSMWSSRDTSTISCLASSVPGTAPSTPHVKWRVHRDDARLAEGSRLR